jgi:hypothetical protein
VKPREIFKLAVRLLGLWFVYLGISNVPSAFVSPLSILFVIWNFLIAWWLLGGASFLVNRAYPDVNREPQAESGNPPASIVASEA